MLICAQWLHLPWIDFRSLPAEERMRWRLFAELYYKRESQAHAAASRRAKSRRRGEEE